MKRRHLRVLEPVMRCAVAVTVAAALGTPLHLSAQVTTAQYDNARTGAALHETVLTPAKVKAGFGRVATLPVDGDVYAQPLYFQNTLIVATENNSVYAFDARSLRTTPLWHVNLGTPLSSRDVRCPFIRPNVGITPTPVIDPASGSIYVLARTTGSGTYEQTLHRLDIRDGRDLAPATPITASVPGTGIDAVHGVVSFDPLRENPRAALLLDHGVVYLAWASSCDVAPYHGWVMAYDAKTLKQRAVLNTSPDGADAGIWQGDAGLAADSAGHVYAATGNGSFDTAGTRRRNFGSSVLQLTLGDTTLTVTDFFTPWNQASLTTDDEDLGSSGPILVPGRLIVLTGKDGMTYVVNRNAMGKFGTTDQGRAVQSLRTSNGGFGAAAYWNHTVYIWGSDDVMKAYAVARGGLTLREASRVKATDPGSTPTVSANGDRQGIVWAIETRTWNGQDKPAVLHAFDASDVRVELFNSGVNPRRDGAGPATRFAIPTVAAGRVYVGAKGEVDVYEVLAGAR
ncbi:MAG TPA: PQQ-binding-like beta-propeller repeat protein [Gemmatimonadales bacterium]|jgi:hypothetical protein|nr:PQQ-binding-like beta-propeller repeat protein [Gemmatimonadales bacterium]